MCLRWLPLSLRQSVTPILIWKLLPKFKYDIVSCMLSVCLCKRQCVIGSNPDILYSRSPSTSELSSLENRFFEAFIYKKKKRLYRIVIMSLFCCLSTNSFFRSFSHWRHNTKEKLVHISVLTQLVSRLTMKRPELSILSILLRDC